MIIACKDTKFYDRRFTMKRAFIYLTVFSLVVASCGTVGQYSGAYRYQDGIYYKAESSGEVHNLANAAGTQFNDKLNITYDEYGWSTASTSSSIVYVPVYAFGYPYYYDPFYYPYSSWYYGNSWYWNDWYWNDWHWNGWYWDRWCWHDRYYWHRPPHHYHHEPYHQISPRREVYSPHRGSSAVSSGAPVRVNPGSATRSSSSASYNGSSSVPRRSGTTSSSSSNGSSTYRRSSTTNNSSAGSSSYRSSTSRSSAGGSSYRSSGSTSRSSSGASSRSSSGSSSRSSGGSSRGRR